MPEQEFILGFIVFAGPDGLLELASEWCWVPEDSRLHREERLDGSCLDLGVPQDQPATGDIFFSLPEGYAAVPTGYFSAFLGRTSQKLRHFNLIDPQQDVRLTFENPPWQARRRKGFLELSPALPEKHTISGVKDWLDDCGMDRFLQAMIPVSLRQEKAAGIPASPFLRELENGLVPREERRWARISEKEADRLLTAGTEWNISEACWLKYIIIYWIHHKQRKGVWLISDQLAVDISSRLSFISAVPCRIGASIIESAWLFEDEDRQWANGRATIFYKELVIGQQHYRLGFRIHGEKSLHILADRPAGTEEALQQPFVDDGPVLPGRDSRECLRLVCN